jgi:hypothetical protein
VSECIGYCDDKSGPTFQHPEYSADALCAECLIGYWEEDYERYVGEMKASIEETGLTSDLMESLET